jgi:hypothetical protein
MMNLNECDGSSHGLILGTIPSLALRDDGKHKNLQSGSWPNFEPSISQI